MCEVVHHSPSNSLGGGSMSVIDNKARGMIQSATRKVNPIAHLDKAIRQEQDKFHAAALILARQHFTDTPPPAYGCVPRPQPYVMPKFERRHADVGNLKFKESFSKSKFKDAYIGRPSQQVTMRGYRDGKGGGSCFIMAPPKISGKQGWSTGLIIKRKFYKVFDLQ